MISKSQIQKLSKFTYISINQPIKTFEKIIQSIPQSHKKIWNKTHNFIRSTYLSNIIFATALRGSSVRKTHLGSVWYLFFITEAWVQDTRVQIFSICTPTASAWIRHSCLNSTNHIAILIFQWSNPKLLIFHNHMIPNRKKKSICSLCHSLNHLVIIHTEETDNQKPSIPITADMLNRCKLPLLPNKIYPFKQKQLKWA